LKITTLDVRARRTSACKGWRGRRCVSLRCIGSPAAACSTRPAWLESKTVRQPKIILPTKVRPTYVRLNDITIRVCEPKHVTTQCFSLLGNRRIKPDAWFHAMMLTSVQTWILTSTDRCPEGSGCHSFRRVTAIAGSGKFEVHGASRSLDRRDRSAGVSTFVRGGSGRFASATTANSAG